MLSPSPWECMLVVCGLVRRLLSSPGMVSLAHLTCMCVLCLQIDDHSMVVVSVDALPIQPSKPLKAIRINAGQRYDLLVCPDVSIDGVLVAASEFPARDLR